MARGRTFDGTPQIGCPRVGALMSEWMEKEEWLDYVAVVVTRWLSEPQPPPHPHFRWPGTPDDLMRGLVAAETK